MRERLNFLLTNPIYFGAILVVLFLAAIAVNMFFAVPAVGVLRLIAFIPSLLWLGLYCYHAMKGL